MFFFRPGSISGAVFDGVKCGFVEKPVLNQSYEEYLLLPEAEVKVVGKIYSGKVIRVEDCFVSDEPLLDLRVCDVERKDMNEKMPECILSEGREMFFEKRGMYRITVSFLDQNDVSGKRHFYIYVK